MRLCVSALRASIAVLSAAAPRETAFEEFPALRITVFSAVFLGVFLETVFVPSEFLPLALLQTQIASAARAPQKQTGK